MSIASHLHQLFNTETCQAYLHALRWKDRPLQCPRCQSHHVGPWGTYHYQPGLQRYRCKEKACKRTFNDLTGTLLDGSKRSLAHWILATFLLCLACSSRRIAGPAMRRDEHARQSRKVARIQCARQGSLPSKSVPVRSLKVRLQSFLYSGSVSVQAGNALAPQRPTWWPRTSGHCRSRSFQRNAWKGAPATRFGVEELVEMQRN